MVVDLAGVRRARLHRQKAALCRDVFGKVRHVALPLQLSLFQHIDTVGYPSVRAGRFTAKKRPQSAQARPAARSSRPPNSHPRNTHDAASMGEFGMRVVYRNCARVSAIKRRSAGPLAAIRRRFPADAGQGMNVVAAKHRGVWMRGANETDKHVGARLKMRRHMLDMSQTQLADAIGLTFQQVQKYEMGVNRISASRLQHLAAVLGVPIAFFFEGAPAVPGQTSQNATPDYVSEFISSVDGLALIEAFGRIKDAELRRRLVRLVEQTTAEE